MKLNFHRRFLKQRKKLSVKQQAQLDRRLELFLRHPFDALLNNHALTGPYSESRSIDVTGDVRAIYEQVDQEILFTHVGTHSQLYG